MLRFNRGFIETLKHAREFARTLRNHRYEVTESGGLYLPQQGLLLQGVYSHEAPDGLGVIHDTNRIVGEGLTHIWEATIAGGTRHTQWYVALGGANVTPSASWTAATYASSASEIISGYNEGSRPEFTASTPAAGSTNNTANRATFTAAEENVSIWGAAVLSNNNKGGTLGKLLSASTFSTVRTLPEIGDQINIGITLTATAPT